MNREELVKNVIDNIKNGIFVEIGTDSGVFSNFILENSCNSKLYCIDPYQKYLDYKDAINNLTGDELYQKVFGILKNKYGERIKFIRKFSNDAVNFIPNEIDFLYIDGNHQYSYVLDDLKNYFDKVKKGGVIIGDDAVDTYDKKRNFENDVYIEWCPGCYGNYGVIKAFDDFLVDKNVEKKIIGTQYYVKKL